MATNKSKGVLQVFTNDPIELNAALLEICQRIDELNGLRGRAEIHDRVGVGAPSESGDAARLGNIPGVTQFVELGGSSTSNELGTASQLRFVDEDGNLIHGIIE